MGHKNPTNLIWIDLEMTGLNSDSDRILEIATIVTDQNLNILAEGPDFVLHQDHTILDTMDEWNVKQHTQSGLIAKVKTSQTTAAEAEMKTLEFLSQYVPANCSSMCGNSICQDRRFLYRWMPKLEKYFHYRNLDVSTIKELAKAWAPNILKGVSKGSTHRALDDIKDSINELIYYRDTFFKF